MTTYSHMSISIVGALKNALDDAIEYRNDYLKGMLADDDGRHLSRREVIDIFVEELQKGHTLFCGCDNRRPDGGCAGHEEPSPE